MLTQNQEKIISDIKDEFAKINATKLSTRQGDLIDRRAIDEAINESIILRKELDLKSESVFKLAKLKMAEDLNRLNSDLDGMNLIAIDKSDDFYARGQIKIIGSDSCRDNVIDWQYNYIKNRQTQPDGGYKDYKDGILNVEAGFSYNGARLSYNYKSIEDMFEDEKVKVALMNLYKKSCI